MERDGEWGWGGMEQGRSGGEQWVRTEWSQPSSSMPGMYLLMQIYGYVAIDPVPLSAVFYQPRALQTKVSAINSGHFGKQGSSHGKSQMYVMWLLFWQSL